MVDERYSGHQSFVCRYGWLRKMYDAIEKEPLLFKSDAKAMIELGIGRNMVKSVQFWGEAFGVISGSTSTGYFPTDIGRALLDYDKGLDPYLEDVASLWLLHWLLSTRANLGGWNALNEDLRDSQFTKGRLVDIAAARAERAKGALSSTTIEQHVTILLGTYCGDWGQAVLEDSLGSPLQELGLIRYQQSLAGERLYELVSGSKITLTPGVFLFALVDYWSRYSTDSHAIALRELTYNPKSPGAIFRLDEDSIIVYLENLSRLTKGKLRFVETADTRNIVCQDKADLTKLAKRLQLN